MYNSIHLSPFAIAWWIFPVFVWGLLSLFVGWLSAILIRRFLPVFPRRFLPVLVRRTPLPRRRSAMLIIVIGNIRRIAISPERLFERRSIGSLVGRVECRVSIPPIVPSPRR